MARTVTNRFTRKDKSMKHLMRFFCLAFLAPLFTQAATVNNPPAQPTPAAKKITADADYAELPKPDFTNTFYLVPIHEAFNAKARTNAQREKDIAQLNEEIGFSRLYRQLGFSGSSPQRWNKAPVGDFLPVLEEHGLVWYAHHHVCNHSLAGHEAMLNAVKKDRRNAAWRHDGDCRGAATNGWSDLTRAGGPDSRAMVDVSVSRLNTDVVAARREVARWLNEDVQHAQMEREHPYTMIAVGHSVENELAAYPHAWSCFSPYSIAEFQQWLRHTGIYDDKTGKFKGQGAQETVIGKLVRIRGEMRSQFYDDPSPRDANGTGISFNKFFGTDFETWKLEYWDFADYPPGKLAWNADLTNRLPKEGEPGNTPGKGFDAPHIADSNSNFFMAFDNENINAKGYRQFSIWAWNMDTARDFAGTGFPAQRIFSHQIPGEALGALFYPPADGNLDKRRHIYRRFTTASPTWTADDGRGDYGGFGAGITIFTAYAFNEDLMKRMRGYDLNWACLEYHPDAHTATPDYEKCMKSLRLLHKYRCHILAPGWWGYTKPPFMLNHTDFARALKDWMNNPTGDDDSDQPYYNEKPVTYRPPLVQEVKVSGNKVSWSKRMWPDVPYATWSLWREFAGGAFRVYRNGKQIAEVPGNQFEFVDKVQVSRANYTVTAVRKKGVELQGKLSAPAKAGP